MTNKMLAGWKAVLIPAAAMLFLALLPQIALWLGGQGQWNGSYFVSNYDEPAYSAYVNALIRGEPRRNDPFVGLADNPKTPQPETLYSIQFIPPYVIAIPARLLGLNASTAFILLSAFIAVFSVLAIYKLLIDVTGDRLVSAIGPLVILCLGTAAALQGELRYLLDGRVLTDFLPFLRRYQPGLAFPLFFVFCLLAWKAVRSASLMGAARSAAGAGGVFAVFVFSYFYLWTAAAAWLACFAGASILFERSRLKNVITALAVIGIMAITALAPYFYMLANRSADMDSVQLLTYTRLPDLVSPSMWIGIVVIATALFLLRDQGSRSAGRLPLILSLAVTPVILFNQQVLTGRSLQPVHYELFIGNYLVLTAALLTMAAWRAADGVEGISTARFQRGLVYLGIAAFAWGLFESYGSTTRNFTPAVIRDASVPAILAAAHDTEKPVILATNFITADFIPSVGTARPLWNPHTSSAGGVGIEENKRLFHLYLYFSGYSEKDLDAALTEGSFEVTSAVFGAERALPLLGGDSRPITSEEIRAEIASFAQLTRSIVSQNAYSPVVDHIIVPAEAEPDFTNLDRWYTRGEGQTFGLFRIYRLAPKPTQ